jgi:hypothetical protein
MAKGVKKFSKEHSNNIALVLKKSTALKSSGKPWTSIEFLAYLKAASKHSYNQKTLYEEARRVAKHIRKGGEKAFIPQWRESHDLLTAFRSNKEPIKPK